MGPVQPPRSAAAAAAAAAAIARASGIATIITPHASSTVATAVSADAQSTRPAPPPVLSPIANKISPSASPSRDHVVRLLTFNLWFEPLAMAARMRAIGAYIEKLRPAVIGFQEVTRESLAMLRKQRWAAYYDCSVDAAPPFSEAYFVVLFSALRVLSFESHPFAQTGMGRELLAARVEVSPGRTLLVSTSHLESLPQFARERVSQLKQSFAFLQERVDSQTLGAVLMGDTNLLRGDMKRLDPLAFAEEEITMEEAKTSRAKCRKCGDAIEKGTVRVGKTAKDKLPNGKTVEITMWFHRECFLAHGMMPEHEKQIVREAMAPSKAEKKTGEIEEEDGQQDTAARGLPPHWRDLWLAVPGNTEANGFTYDGKRNTMIKNKAYQSRLDRVYLYAPTHATRRAFEKIEMVGTKPIADGVWASDHFGLLTTLCFDEAINGSRGGGGGSDDTDDTDAKRKRDDDTGEEEKREATEERSDPKRRASGSKQAPIELE